MNPARGGWLVLVSIVAALILSVAHLPEDWPSWLSWLRPSWVVLVLFFWVVTVPERVGMILVWALGLLVDVLLAEPLGLNGLCYAAVTYVGWSLYERIRMYSQVQQGWLLMMMVVGVGLLKTIVNSIFLDVPWSFAFVFPALTTMIVWMPIAILLDRLAVRFRVQ